MTTILTRRAPGGPVPAGERVLAPDLARGLMLALIALANVVIYLYGRPYGPRQHPVEHDLVDRVVSALTVTFVDARAYPMFAALFAYGMVQIMTRQRRAGASEVEARAVLRRRSGWLIVFGLVHAVLLFSGDILGVYGVLGFVLVAMMRLPDRTLLRLAAGWLVVVALVQGETLGGPDAPEERAFFWSFAVEDPVTVLMLRPVEWLMTPFGVLGVFSAALVGVWAARRGLLTEPERHWRLLARAAAGGLGLAVLGGLPLGLAAGGVWESPSFLLFYAASAVHMVTGIAGGLGYAALIGLLAVRVASRRGPLVRALAAAGERSLTCYLLQSVVFVALLPPFTLGLGGRLGSADAALLALATWAATVVVAEALRRAGRRGPAEALLRRLTYGHVR